MARPTQASKARPVPGGLGSKGEQQTTMAAGEVQAREKGGCRGNTRKTGFQPMGEAVFSVVQCGWCLLCQIQEERKNEGMQKLR